jgi:CRISPR/Cas system-associated exonuclease Cas4 (RecB family)
MEKYKLSPSSSGRFLTCSASLQHNKGSGESEVTLKGSLQHEVAFYILSQYMFKEDHKDIIKALTNVNNWYESKENPNIKVKWSNDFQKTVDNYVSYVMALSQEYDIQEVFLEHKIKMKFHDNEINGTVDCVMLKDNGDVIIVDLKTGRTKVKTEDNNQMLMYAYGVIQDLYNKTKKLPSNIIISINQPLVNNTQAVSYTLQQLMDWYIDKSNVMKEINTGVLVYRPSKEACKFCQFKINCNERIKKGVVV